MRTSQAKQDAIKKLSRMGMSIPSKASLQQVAVTITAMQGKQNPAMTTAWGEVIRKFLNPEPVVLPPMKPLGMNYLKFQRARCGEHVPGYTERLK